MLYRFDPYFSDCLFYGTYKSTYYGTIRHELIKWKTATSCLEGISLSYSFLIPSREFIQKEYYMKEESIKEARKILIERILQSNINSQDKLELCIWIHHIFQPEDYEENRKALQKVLDNKIWR